MLLGLHITSAIMGTVGAYLATGAWFLSPLRSLYKLGRFCTMIGLVGTIITGASLFTNNTTQLLASGKFLSNMTVLVILIITEASFPALKHPTSRTSSHTLSLFSWTWIFAVALLNPPYSYWQLMITYVTLASLLTWLSMKQFPLPLNRPPLTPPHK